MQRFAIFMLILGLMGCAPLIVNTTQPTPLPSATADGASGPIPTSLPSTMGEAHDRLIKFFASLNEGKYAEADTLYGGSYQQMQDWNPDVDSSDHTALWKRACEQNGLQCLKVRSATFKQLRGDTYIFQVEFNNPDGSLFVLGPCCGSNETEMPPVSQFEYSLTRENPEHQFVVRELPPYVP